MSNRLSAQQSDSETVYSSKSVAVYLNVNQF